MTRTEKLNPHRILQLLMILYVASILVSAIALLFTIEGMLSFSGTGTAAAISTSSVAP